ncbi:hypothetical protein TWF730_001122 [Orbilia blumenaviensis]|uniref:Fido domain-containing protein n=1 Tax=Orbilia blumenaviensis TaxID=1796055 RepID=A0AAV9VNY1_9PEZI
MSQPPETSSTSTSNNPRPYLPLRLITTLPTLQNLTNLKRILITPTETTSTPAPSSKTAYLTAIRLLRLIRTHKDGNSVQSSTCRILLASALEMELCRVVFGSNYIDGVARMGLEETMEVCKMVFRYEDVDGGTSGIARNASTADGTDSTTTSAEPEASSTGEEDDDDDEDTKKKRQEEKEESRIQILQHARALRHFLTHYNVQDEPISESLILSTHRVLCTNHPPNEMDGSPWHEWAGKYRTSEIGIEVEIDDDEDEEEGGEGEGKKTGIVRAVDVPEYMRRLIRDFNSRIPENSNINEMGEEEGNANAQPIKLASYLCTQFLTVHPFTSDNGIMSRILLNAVLYKYTGLVASLGSEEGVEGWGRGNMEVERLVGDRVEEGGGRVEGMVGFNFGREEEEEEED